jgi:membrane-associated phospholipid phosphatase
MKSLIRLYESNRQFFLGLIIFLFAALLLLMLFGNATTVISLKAHRCFWVNVFFINYTFLGNGLFAISLAMFFMFYLKQKQTGILLCTGFLLSAILIQIFKNIIGLAPIELYTEPLQNLFYNTDNVNKNYLIFPSSYTAAAFSIAMILELKCKKTFQQIMILLAAILVGYSRIYLVQNSISDVLAGSLTGIFSGVIVYVLAVSKVSIKAKLKSGYKWKINENIAEIQRG